MPLGLLDDYAPPSPVASEDDAAPASDNYWGSRPGFDAGDLIDAPKRAVGAGFDVLDTLGRGSRTLLSTGDTDKAWDAMWDPEKAVSATALRRQYLFGDQGTEGDGFFRGSANPLDWDYGDVVDTVADVGVGAATDPLSYLSFGATAAGEAAGKAGLGYLETVGRAKALTPEAQAAAHATAARQFEQTTGKKLAEGFRPGPNWTGAEDTFLGRMRAGEEGVSLKIPFTDIGTGVTPLNSGAAKAAAVLTNPVEAVVNILGDTGAGRAVKTWASNALEFISQPAIRSAFGFATRDSENMMADEVGKVVREQLAPSVVKLEQKGINPEEWVHSADLLQTMDPRASKIAFTVSDDLAKEAGVKPGEQAYSFLKPDEELAKQHAATLNKIQAMKPEQRAALFEFAQELKDVTERLRIRAGELGAPDMKLAEEFLNKPQELRKQLAKTVQEYKAADAAAQAEAAAVAAKNAKHTSLQAENEQLRQTVAANEGKYNASLDAAMRRSSTAGADNAVQKVSGGATGGEAAAAYKQGEFDARSKPVAPTKESLALGGARESALRSIAKTGEADPETLRLFRLENEAKLGPEAVKFEAARALERAQSVRQAGSAKQVMEILSPDGTPLPEHELRRVFALLGVDKGDTEAGLQKLWNRVLWRHPDGGEFRQTLKDYYKRDVGKFRTAEGELQEPLKNIPNSIPADAAAKPAPGSDKIISKLIPDQAEALRKYPNVLARADELVDLDIEEARRVITELTGDRKAAVQIDKALRALEREGADFDTVGAALKDSGKVKGFASPDDLIQEQMKRQAWDPERIQQAREMGILSENPKELLARDTVTGFYEGRTGNVRAKTQERLLRHVKETGEPGVYAVIDLKNLGGLNAKVADVKANEVYRELAGYVREELEKLGGSTHLFRHGGDEMSAFTAGVSRADVDAALERAKIRAKELEAREGLADAHKPDTPNKRGIGLHTKTWDVKPEEPDFMARAGKELEAEKLRGKNVAAGTDTAVGAGEAGGQTAGTAGRTAEDSAGTGAGRGGVPAEGGRGVDAGSDAGRSADAGGADDLIEAPKTPAQLKAEELQAKITNIQNEIAKADVQARAVPTWFPLRADPELPVQKTGPGVKKSYADSNLSKGRTASRYGEERPELAGVPMTRQAGEARIKKVGARASGYDVPEKAPGVVDSLKKWLKDGKTAEQIKAEAIKDTEFFISNPVEAVARHIGGPWARAIKNADAKASLSATFRVIDKADWLKLETAARDAHIDAFPEFLKDFKKKYGVDVADLAGDQAQGDLRGWLKQGGTGPSGYAEMKDWKGMGGDTFLPAAVAEKWNKYQDLSTRRLPETLAAVFAPLQSYMRQWKGFQTFWWPTFHVRNFVSDMWRLMQEDALDLQTGSDTAKLWVGATKPTSVGAKGLVDPRQFADLTFDAGRLGPISGEQLVSLAQRQGLIRTGYQNSVLMEAGDVAMAKLSKSPGAKALGGIVDAKDAYKNALEWREDIGRLTGFLSRLRKGDSVAEAGLRIEEALFNYGRSSTAVNWLRQTGLAPFSAWMAKNVPAQLEYALSNPAGFMATLRGVKLLQGGEIPEDMIPEYMRDKYNIRMDREKDANGKENWTFVTPNGVIPVLDLQELASSPLDVLKQQLGPIAKAGFSLLDDKDGNEVRGLENLIGKPLGIAKGLMKADTVDPRTGYLSDGIFATLGKRTLLPLTLTEIRDVEATAEKSKKKAANRIKSAEADVKKAVTAMNQASLLFSPEELGRYQAEIDKAAAALRVARQTSTRTQEENDRVLQRVRAMGRAP